MAENKVQFTRNDEHEFVDFIFDCMYENPVHAEIEFMNFTLHFKGSDDRADQAWFIDKMTDYMSEGVIIPCWISMADLALTISDIEAGEYIDHPDVHTEITDTTEIDEDDSDTSNMTAPDLGPFDVVHASDYEKPKDEPVEDKTEDAENRPNFYDLENALADLFKFEVVTMRKRWGDYNIMNIPSGDPNVKRYSFCKSDVKNPDVHYLIFDNTNNETVLSNAFTSYTIANKNDPIKSLKKHDDISTDFVDMLLIKLIIDKFSD